MQERHDAEIVRNFTPSKWPNFNYNSAFISSFLDLATCLSHSTVCSYIGMYSVRISTWTSVIWFSSVSAGRLWQYLSYGHECFLHISNSLIILPIETIQSAYWKHRKTNPSAGSKATLSRTDKLERKCSGNPMEINGKSFLLYLYPHPYSSSPLSLWYLYLITSFLR